MIALLVIGDEILAGDIREENISFMIDTLSEAGHKTGEVRIIRDEVEMIAEAFRELCERYEYVISAGGVGPTHDDVTLEGAARGFGVDLQLNGEMQNFLSEHYGGTLKEPARRMAMLPHGSEIILGTEHRWPIIKRGNAFILPGLPVALRDKVARLARMLPAAGGAWTAVLYVGCDETEIAGWLGKLQEHTPGVKIGSYPVVEGGGFHTRITIKSDDRNTAQEVFEQARNQVKAANCLLGEIPPARNVQHEA